MSLFRLLVSAVQKNISLVVAFDKYCHRNTEGISRCLVYTFRLAHFSA